MDWRDKKLVGIVRKGVFCISYATRNQNGFVLTVVHHCYFTVCGSILDGWILGTSFARQQLCWTRINFAWLSPCTATAADGNLCIFKENFLWKLTRSNVVQHLCRQCAIGCTSRLAVNCWCAACPETQLPLVEQVELTMVFRLCCTPLWQASERVGKLHPKGAWKQKLPCYVRGSAL